MASILSLLETPEPPHLTMKPRAGTLSIAEVNAKIETLLGHSAMGRQERELARATVLLWHDHFDAAHEIAQDVENADGSLLHGILHRREPDYGNARYWFRRVGRHRSFECIAGKLKVIFSKAPDDLVAKQIVANDQWHPLTFVDFLEDNARRKDGAYDALIREIQSAEIHCFLLTLPTMQK